MPDDEDEIRHRAAEILGSEFAYPSSVDGDLNFLYDFYLKFKRAGFNEKQALWLCADLMAGQHIPTDEEGESGEETSGS